MLRQTETLLRASSECALQGCLDARRVASEGLVWHVWCSAPPRYDAKAFTQALAKELVRHAPKHFTASMSKRRREGKIFVDYLRNAREATAIASYSVRARAGAPVATPIHWDELDEHSESPPLFTIDQVKERVAKGVDPWPGLDGAARRLSAGMKRAVGMR